MHHREGFMREMTIPAMVSIIAIVLFALIVPRCGESAGRKLVEIKVEGRVP